MTLAFYSAISPPILSIFFRHENPDFSPTFREIVNAMSEYFDVEVYATRLNFYADGSAWKPFHHDSHAYGKVFSLDMKLSIEKWRRGKRERDGRSCSHVESSLKKRGFAFQGQKIWSFI